MPEHACKHFGNLTQEEKLTGVAFPQGSPPSWSFHAECLLELIKEESKCPPERYLITCLQKAWNLGGNYPERYSIPRACLSPTGGGGGGGGGCGRLGEESQPLWVSEEGSALPNQSIASKTSMQFRARREGWDLSSVPVCIQA